jgi:hypothetical protein
MVDEVQTEKENELSQQQKKKVIITDTFGGTIYSLRSAGGLPATTKTGMEGNEEMRMGRDCLQIFWEWDSQQP